MWHGRSNTGAQDDADEDKVFSINASISTDENSPISPHDDGEEIEDLDPDGELPLLVESHARLVDQLRYSKIEERRHLRSLMLRPVSVESYKRTFRLFRHVFLRTGVVEREFSTVCDRLEVLHDCSYPDEAQTIAGLERPDVHKARRARINGFYQKRPVVMSNLDVLEEAALHMKPIGAARENLAVDPREKASIIVIDVESGQSSLPSGRPTFRKVRPREINLNENDLGAIRQLRREVEAFVYRLSELRCEPLHR
jgi:hypothetical protein